MDSGATTLTQAFRDTVARCPDRVAVRTIDDAVSLTWAALAARVDALAGGLARLGLKRGDTCAIMLSNRPEFHVVDLAATMLGATPFSVYQTLPPDQIAYVVGDAGARIAVVEPAFLPAMLAARRSLPALEHLIVVGGEAPAGTTPLAEVEGSQPGFDVEAAWRAVTPDDLLTLIYTSGTTGPPKGVQLTHRNIIACARATQSLVRFEEGTRVISWLPAAHIAERAAHHYLPIVYGFTIT
ncbi:MAG TPA: AMP-binding protein, partial [Candidatus Binatus sp.]|nr:AMP-binding protein [Candidatus Binatus sp.]